MSVTKTVDDLIDTEGFLTDPELWNRDLALALAAELGIQELTETHWRVIDTIRDDYIAHRKLARMAQVCRKLDLDGDCVHRLFGGPVRAWKIAGLPDPGSEARTAMENEDQD